jgi:hypothetical protein
MNKCPDCGELPAEETQTFSGEGKWRRTAKCENGHEWEVARSEEK